MSVYMRYFPVYLFTILFLQSTFVKASNYEALEFKPVRKIVLSLLPQTSYGFKDFLNYRLVSQQFRIDSSDPSLWMRFLPILGLGPNVDSGGNVLFFPPLSPTRKWTVPDMLAHLSPMLEVAFAPDTRTDSYPCQWACYRLVELFEKQEYEKLIPQDGKPKIADVAKALLVVHSANGDRKIKERFERFSTLEIFDECSDLHNLRVALMQPLIQEILRRIADYKKRVVQIGCALIDPDSFTEEQQKIKTWLVREGGELGRLSYTEEFAKYFLEKITDLKPEDYNLWRYCYESYEQMNEELQEMLLWIGGLESELGLDNIKKCP